ncbi:hypothetical protein DACRYDRAFT_114441 [Dacryopinax primogenitus]|uniref:Letm1 RBD domain-containing protein n=1 Tax=Dacryopinax primogenitus (strain DJM 731) TaxID=1858805 RepID=M5G5M3_DACPD|nr:uncharacterized protein DACRYDRAFT_114441 [Dacryopinax primogenitus]EJU04004.1 hypothetical protein DACRYDRAFT_114441 [Dacryopinax primogenitus]
MFSAVIVQRQAAHLYRSKSPLLSTSELSIRAFHGRPSALRYTRLYATVPTTSERKLEQPLRPPSTEGKKKKVELRPSPKLPETPIQAKASKSNAPPPPAPKFTPSELDAAPQPLPIPSTPEVAQPHGLRSAIDIAISDVLRASREGQLAPIDPFLPWVQRMFRLGIELAKFYWRGTKRFFEHRKIVGDIGRRCEEERRGRTWREERFVQLYKSDRIKLLPFILTILILEEVVPLIVIYAPFLLPSTCILPSQQERMEAARITKHRAALAQLGAALNQAPSSEKATSQFRIADLSPQLVKGLCGALSLRTYLPTPFLRWTLSSHLTLLETDDQLLLPALPGLDVHELRQAVTERGGLAEGAGEKQLRVWLARWMEGVKPTLHGEGGERRARLILEYAARQWDCGKEHSTH